MNTLVETLQAAFSAPNAAASLALFAVLLIIALLFVVLGFVTAPPASRQLPNEPQLTPERHARLAAGDANVTRMQTLAKRQRAARDRLLEEGKAVDTRGRPSTRVASPVLVGILSALIALVAFVGAHRVMLYEQVRMTERAASMVAGRRDARTHNEYGGYIDACGDLPGLVGDDC